MMKKNSGCETFRSEIGSFDKNFADYMIRRNNEKMKVRKCIFFEDHGKGYKWASCLFDM
jgi:hypothetical protein